MGGDKLLPRFISVADFIYYIILYLKRLVHPYKIWVTVVYYVTTKRLISRKLVRALRQIVISWFDPIARLGSAPEDVVLICRHLKTWDRRAIDAHDDCVGVGAASPAVFVVHDVSLAARVAARALVTDAVAHCKVGHLDRLAIVSLDGVAATI